MATGQMTLSVELCIGRQRVAEVVRVIGWCVNGNAAERKAQMKKMIMMMVVVSACVGVCTTFAAQEVVVHPTGVTGHDGGNWPDYAGHLTDMLNGTDIGFLTPDHLPGMDTSADTTEGTNNPAVWTWANGTYQATWHANSILASTNSANGKIGWVVIDLGEVVGGLSKLYMWASSISATESGKEQVRDYNLYYSSGAGIDALPPMPKSKGTTGDYDFSSGDWTLIGSNTLGSVHGAVSNTNVLGGVSARYIGIEVMTIAGVDTRMAIAQVEITRALPPAGTVLIIK